MGRDGDGDGDGDLHVKLYPLNARVGLAVRMGTL